MAFAGLILAPDLSALGYLAGRRIGALRYNLGHNLVGPALLFALGWFLATPVLLAVGAIWWTHIGMDRQVGYGMKRTDDFTATHLAV